MPRIPLFHEATGALPTLPYACHIERSNCANWRRPPVPVIAFAIFRAERNCLISRFTSVTLVPLPRAILFLRLPLMTVWSRRSRSVMESIMAMTSFNSRSGTCHAIASFSF